MQFIIIELLVVSNYTAKKYNFIRKCKWWINVNTISLNTGYIHILFFFNIWKSRKNDGFFWDMEKSEKLGNYDTKIGTINCTIKVDISSFSYISVNLCTFPYNIIHFRIFSYIPTYLCSKVQKLKIMYRNVQKCVETYRNIRDVKKHTKCTFVRYTYWCWLFHWLILWNRVTYMLYIVARDSPYKGRV